MMLLDSITDESFYKLVPLHRTSNPVEHFVDLYNTRLFWLQEHAPKLSYGMEKLNQRGLHRQVLKDALHRTGEAMLELIRKAVDDGRIKNFRTPHEFLMFVFTQEAQSRNNILLASLHNLN